MFLLPSRTDTRWWHDYITKPDVIRFIRGRLKFDDQKNSAPFPSAIVVFKHKNMENRIDRKVDESLYQPKIHSDRIRELYSLKLETGIPMTVLLDQAIRELKASYSVHSPQPEELILEIVDQETWEEICEYRRFLDEMEYQKCLGELEK